LLIARRAAHHLGGDDLTTGDTMTAFSPSKHGIRSWSELASAVESRCDSANAASDSAPIQRIANQSPGTWSADFLQILRCLIDGAA
jgi:hypothetical protein